MSKIGRNDPCFCGSGKKYKKCCMDKDEPVPMNPDKKKKIVDDFKQYLNSFWSAEEVELMSTLQIIQALEEMGIAFDEKVFLSDTEKFYSAEELSESWFKRFKPAIKGRDEDFPFFAALILWGRLAPDRLMPMEKMSDLIDQGFECFSENDSAKGCDLWLRVWAALTNRIKPEYQTMGPLDTRYKSSFYISNFCQDLEHELRDAGMEYPSYFYKRINYCREFCSYFPGESELILHNMKRAVADSFASLGDYDQADRECAKLVADYPNNPWGYIEWGDQYFLGPRKDYAKAGRYFEMAKRISLEQGNEEDLMVVEERLEDLNKRESMLI